jgi:hypothetical protein
MTNTQELTLAIFTKAIRAIASGLDPDCSSAGRQHAVSMPKWKLREIARRACIDAGIKWNT